jgi:hypothetical protein
VSIKINEIAIDDPTQRGKWTSASNAQADSLCAGRHLAQSGIPDTHSADAEFGNALHAALAAGSDAGLTPQQQDIYLSFLEIEKKVLVQFFGKEVEGLTPKPVVERRYWAKWPDGLQHSGQIDRVHRKGTKALIVECKSLVGEIPESPRNMQLRDQASLYDINTALIDELGVVVIQPLATHSPELCIYKRPDLMRAREEMYFRVNNSNNASAARTAGAVQCKFCKAKSKCVEYQQYAGSLVPVNRSLVDVPVASWTAEQRKQFCDSFDVAQKWLNMAWDEMEKGAAADPEFVPSYRLVDGSPRSSIINLQSVFDRASKHGVPLDKFLAASTISKTALETMTRDATKAKGKKLKEHMEEIIGSDVKVSEVKKSLKKV